MLKRLISVRPVCCLHQWQTREYIWRISLYSESWQSAMSTALFDRIAKWPFLLLTFWGACTPAKLPFLQSAMYLYYFVPSPVLITLSILLSLAFVLPGTSDATDLVPISPVSHEGCSGWCTTHIFIPRDFDIHLLQFFSWCGFIHAFKACVFSGSVQLKCWMFWKKAMHLETHRNTSRRKEFEKRCHSGCKTITKWQNYYLGLEEEELRNAWSCKIPECVNTLWHSELGRGGTQNCCQMKWVYINV